MKTFSDNVLVAFPFGSNKSLADGELVARFLGELQMQVRQLTLLAGFPMRGGIVVGSLAMTDQFVFGRALVEAVELEKRAVFPRIVLGESVLKLIPPDSHAAQMVVRDSDGASFLHYLESFPAMMATHREFVETGLRGFASRPRERQKYEWLAQYHNYFAREIGQPEHVIEVDREGAFSFRAGTRLPTPFEALRLGSRAK